MTAHAHPKHLRPLLYTTVILAVAAMLGLPRLAEHAVREPLPSPVAVAVEVSPAAETSTDGVAPAEPSWPAPQPQPEPVPPMQAN